MARPISSSDLPPDLARFAEAEVAAGHSASVEDVLRAGKEALEQQQRRRARHEAKLAEIDAALEEGERSGIAEDYSLEGTLAKLGLCGVGR
jgi:putative addiction module CopG family antidote